MIAFITSIRHPGECRSYEWTGERLDRTLRSVCAQSDGDFVVLVVANRKPAISCQDPRIHFVEVQFPPPIVEEGMLPSDRVPVDKGIKYLAGLIGAKAYHPDHVMFFDYDDFIHRDIAAFANAHPAADGWYIDRGHVYWDGSGRVTPVQNFHKLCGTSNILAYRLFELPEGLVCSAPRKEFLAAAGHSYITAIGRHKETAEYFIGKGCSIEALPLRGAIWVRGAAEHVEPSRGFPSFAGKPVTEEIRRDFQLDAPSTTLLRELSASLPQILPVWREALRDKGWKSALVETFWKGPLRLVGSLRGKEWKP